MLGFLFSLNATLSLARTVCFSRYKILNVLTKFKYSVYMMKAKAEAEAKEMQAQGLQRGEDFLDCRLTTRFLASLMCSPLLLVACVYFFVLIVLPFSSERAAERSSARQDYLRYTWSATVEHRMCIVPQSSSMPPSNCLFEYQGICVVQRDVAGWTSNLRLTFRSLPRPRNMTCERQSFY